MLIQLSWGWLNAKRARKASSVLVELLSATSHHPPNGRNDYISSCTLSRTATAAPLCQVFQENMAAMLWTGARGVVWMVRASVCVRVCAIERDGWQLLIILPITLHLRQHWARYHSTSPSSSSSPSNANPPRPDGVRVSDFLIIHQVRMTHGDWTALRRREKKRRRKMRSRGGGKERRGEWEVEDRNKKRGKRKGEWNWHNSEGRGDILGKEDDKQFRWSLLVARGSWGVWWWVISGQVNNFPA